MATVTEILSKYRYAKKTDASHQAEQVDGDAGGQVADGSQAVEIWDRDEAIGQTASDAVLAQTAAVRAMLPDPGFGSPVAMDATSKIMIGDPKNNRPGVDRSNCVMFLDRKDPSVIKTLVAELDVECKQAKAAIAATTEPAAQTKARITFMQHMAFKHLMNGREGPLSAINTYDDQIFTWGMGFGAIGGLPMVLDRIYAIEQANAPNDLEKHYVQKLFYLCGFKFNGKFWVVDTTKKKVYASRTPDVNADDDAFRYIHDTLAFHFMWSLLARDELTRKTLVQAQREIFFERTGRISQADKVQTGALYTMLSHFQHWTGESMDWISWATGSNGRPRVTEAMPSEKADALIAVQAVHRIYHKRSPNYDKNGFADHTRDYWAQMVGEDTLDEGLTDFHPDYPNMTAGKVSFVPDDHLGARTRDGKYYDLGPLTDFCRDPPGAPKSANWVEQDPPLALPGPMKSSEPPPASDAAPVSDPSPASNPASPPKEDSWWTFLFRAPSWDACFAGGTPVACPAGPRPIEELVEGDEVLACDAAGAVVVARVARTLVHAPEPCLLLHVEGEAPIRLTENHPVLVRGEWRPAGELRPGDELTLLRQTCRGSAERRVAPWGPGLVPGETKASAAAPRSGERSSANEVCRSSAKSARRAWCRETPRNGDRSPGSRRRARVRSHGCRASHVLCRDGARPQQAALINRR